MDFAGVVKALMELKRGNGQLRNLLSQFLVSPLCSLYFCLFSASLFRSVKLKPQSQRFKDSIAPRDLS